MRFSGAIRPRAGERGGDRRPTPQPFVPAPTEAARAEPTPAVSAEAVTSLWIIAGLAMAPAVAQGFGRFAYALVLPAMRDDLGWSWADAGAMGTANAIGYLIGAIGAAGLAGRYGAKRVFSLSLAFAAVAITSAAAASDYWGQGALRIAAGAASGVAFVVGGALAAAAASGGGAARAPTALGVYVAGAGVGIALSALVVPAVVAEAGWRGGWIALGLLSALAALIAAPAIQRTPAPAAQAGGARKSLDLKPILPAFVAYGLLGAGYIAYATFVVAHLKAELGFTSVEVSAFWTTLGLSIVVFTFLWGPVLGRLRGGLGLIATTTVMIAGVSLVLVEPTRTGAYVSAILFGASGLASVTAVTTLARRVYPPERWTAAIGLLTVAFGVGQIVGPVLSGFVSDGPHGLRAGLILSLWIMAATVATAAFQRERRAP